MFRWYCLYARGGGSCNFRLVSRLLSSRLTSSDCLANPPSIRLKGYLKHQFNKFFTNITFINWALNVLTFTRHPVKEQTNITSER